MRQRTAWQTLSARAAFGGIFLAVAAVAAWSQTATPWRPDVAAYARPTTIPVPPDNPGAEAAIALGAALFNDTRLSRDNTHSCATCHDPAKGFTDGASRGKGIAGVTLKRNTPTLWNLAWADSFFWDGRAASLEAQARGPIEHPLEMNMKLADAVPIFKADPQMAAAFEVAFGEAGVSEDTILKALAAFERTLVSPKTRFDRWVEGDATALTKDEIKGFELFNGRAACSKCHGGWRFTDEAYHDIGLPGSTDNGRGDTALKPELNNAFKTPSLRELVWTAPYMHDGSFGTLEGVNDHYFGGVENRPTISPDVPLIIPVFSEQRRQMTAFLKTLSSETPPSPVPMPPRVKVPESTNAVAASRVSLKDKAFTPSAVRIGKGETLRIVNDDVLTHRLHASGGKGTVSPVVQEPGASAEVTFQVAGTYTLSCDIQPGVRLTVEVSESDASLDQNRQR